MSSTARFTPHDVCRRTLKWLQQHEACKVFANATSIPGWKKRTTVCSPSFTMHPPIVSYVGFLYPPLLLSPSLLATGAALRLRVRNYGSRGQVGTDDRWSMFWSHEPFATTLRTVAPPVSSVNTILDWRVSRTRHFLPHPAI